MRSRGPKIESLGTLVIINQSHKLWVYKKRSFDLQYQLLFESPITSPPNLLSLFSIERHVSIIFRRAGCTLCFLRKSARYFESLGSIKEFHLTINQLFKYYWEIRKGSNKPIASPFLAIGVMLAYFRISVNILFFTQVLNVLVTTWKHMRTKLTMILTGMSLKSLALF